MPPEAGATGADDAGEEHEEVTEGQPSPTITSLTPDAVRNSPEYKTKAAEARREAREKGTLAAENARLRGELESSRTAAEANARESQLAGVKAVLGDEGIALYDEIAELSASDPVAAATKIRELGVRLAQNQPPPAGSGEPAQGAPAGGFVPPQQQAPFPPTGVSASAPLGQSDTDNSYEQIGNEAEKRYQDVVAVVQGPISGRNRITGKIRTGAIMDFLVSSYAKVVDQRQKSGARR